MLIKRNPKTRAVVTMLGISKFLGVSRKTVYNRINTRKLDLDNIPRAETSRGILYDLEAFARQEHPNADDNGIAMILYQFKQEHGRYVRQVFE